MPVFTHDEHSLFYREEGSGPPLVILPGNTATSAHHIADLEYFGAFFHAVAVDFWGTGQSDRIEPPWPLEWWELAARDTLALIEHLGEGPAVLVGTSGGGTVALLAAALGPELVRAVIADSCAERWPVEAIRPEIAERAQRNEWSIDFWRLGHGEDWETVVDADSDMLLRFAQAGGDAYQGRLMSILCPVLLTASLADRSLPDTGPQLLGMARQIPGSQAYFASEGAHPLMWSNPERFRAAAQMFLGQVAL